MKTEPGKPYPLGATCTAEGVNFSVYSRSAHLLELLLFDRADADQPAERIALHREFHRTGDYWHVFIPGLKPGQLYGYHAHGNFHPEQGKRFDGEKVLLDPYTRAVWGQKSYRRPDARKSGTNYPTSLKSVVTDTQSYDWEGDQPLRRRGGKTVIYEMHVRGFTRDPSSGLNEQVRGTYRGIIEKIPYLKDLGVTAVELMPVHEFDPQDAPAGKSNYWGYSPIAFFAPHSGYSNAESPLGVLDDFRDMVKALHHADIEVIVDVVLNHTGEVDEKGPTLSMRGLENEVYYILDRADLARYTNYAGCGNVINSNHSVVRRLIRDCLRYWVREMHVDGFRFDLASIFSRGEDGKVMANPPVIWTIDSDPVLAGSRIIAEAWDAGGLYQVGRFAGERFQEWNGPFRDEVRRFVKGDTHTVANLQQRISGSMDLFRAPWHSVNFVTAHDGFTLNDLVSYNGKHNLANGENNRDGSDANHSWNCGTEGPSTDPAVETLRERQIRNLILINTVSLGNAMMLMGDEVRRTQRGNNNAFCQDNPLSWMDWNLVKTHSGLLRYCRYMIDLVKNHLAFHHRVPPVPIQWHGTQPGRPDLGENSHSLAFTLEDKNGLERFYVALNAFWEPLDFTLPDSSAWRCLVNTANPSPRDVYQPGEAPRVEDRLRVDARSCMLLFQDV